jgi:hypothetical protein
MALDLAALRAKIAAQKLAKEQETKNEASASPSANLPTSSATAVVVSESSPAQGTPQSNAVVPTVSAPERLGTAKTTEIDHLNFIGKMNSLAEAIHHQHPTMPVLLKQIHTHLRNDPELVTTLDEEGIGIIVRGLQIQTKTELVTQAVKDTSGRKKKSAALSTDMF